MSLGVMLFKVFNGTHHMQLIKSVTLRAFRSHIAIVCLLAWLQGGSTIAWAYTEVAYSESDSIWGVMTNLRPGSNSSANSLCIAKGGKSCGVIRRSVETGWGAVYKSCDGHPCNHSIELGFPTREEAMRVTYENCSKFNKVSCDMADIFLEYVGRNPNATSPKIESWIKPNLSGEQISRFWGFPDVAEAAPKWKEWLNGYHACRDEAGSIPDNIANYDKYMSIKQRCVAMRERFLASEGLGKTLGCMAGRGYPYSLDQVMKFLVDGTINSSKIFADVAHAYQECGEQNWREWSMAISVEADRKIPNEVTFEWIRHWIASYRKIYASISDWRRSLVPGDKVYTREEQDIKGDVKWTVVKVKGNLVDVKFVEYICEASEVVDRPKYINGRWESEFESECRRGFDKVTRNSFRLEDVFPEGYDKNLNVTDKTGKPEAFYAPYRLHLFEGHYIPPFKLQKSN